MEKKFTEGSIQIKATPKQVWKVLTSAEYTPQYMFNCAVETDWIPGSACTWKGVADHITYVDGKVIAFEPHQLIVYSTVDPSGKYPDTEDNHLLVEYILEPTETGTFLTIRQGDYNQVACGKERYKESMSYGGWIGILEKIKEIAETSKKED